MQNKQSGEGKKGNREERVTELQEENKRLKELLEKEVKRRWSPEFKDQVWKRYCEQNKIEL